MELFNYTISQKESIIRFVNYLLNSMPNLESGRSICVKLEKPLENETVEASFNSPMGSISCKISGNEYMQNMDALMTQLNVFATIGSRSVVKTLSRLEINTVVRTLLIAHMMKLLLCSNQ